MVNRELCYIENVSEVVVFSDDEVPVSVTYEPQPHNILHTDAADASFGRDIAALGIIETEKLLKVVNKG